MRIIWILLLTGGMLCRLPLVQAQNNPIFNGAGQDGSDAQTTAIPSHNAIFYAGVEDGYAQGRHALPANHPIFSGGIEDGSDLGYFVQTHQNRILGGGADDGASSAIYQLPANNNIFQGGQDDGYAQESGGLPAHNAIFGGGIDDGYANFMAIGLPARFPPIFPVELLSFDAWPADGQVEIEWVSSQEINLEMYVVEKSSDLENLQEVGHQFSRGGQDEITGYEMVDPHPYLGKSFYRLRSIDLDGSFSLSSWVEVWMEAREGFQLLAFPNPTQGLIHVQLHADIGKNISLGLFDLYGKALVPDEAIFLQGDFQVDWQLEHLPAGIYFLRALDRESGEIISLKLQKQ